MEQVNHCSIAVNPARIWICAAILFPNFRVISAKTAEDGNILCA